MPSSFIARRRVQAPQSPTSDAHSMHTTATRRSHFRSKSLTTLLGLPLSSFKKAFSKGSATDTSPGDPARGAPNAPPGANTVHPVRFGRSLDVSHGKPFSMSTPYLITVSGPDDRDAKPDPRHIGHQTVHSASSSSGSHSPFSQSPRQPPTLSTDNTALVSSSDAGEAAFPDHPSLPPTSTVMSKPVQSPPQTQSQSQTLPPPTQSQHSPPTTTTTTPQLPPSASASPRATQHQVEASDQTIRGSLRLNHPVLPPGSIRRTPTVRPESIRLTPSIVIRAPTRPLPALPVPVPVQSTPIPRPNSMHQDPGVRSMRNSMPPLPREGRAPTPDSDPDMMDDETDDDDSTEADPTSSRPSIQLRHSSDDDDVANKPESYFDARENFGVSTDDVTGSSEEGFPITSRFVPIPSSLSKEIDTENDTTKIDSMPQVVLNEWSPQKDFSVLGIEVSPPPTDTVFEHPPSARTHNESILHTPRAADFLPLVKEDDDRPPIPSTKITPPTPDASMRKTGHSSTSQSATVTGSPHQLPVPLKQRRPSLYSQQSHSMINLPSMSPHRHSIDLKGKSPLLQPHDIPAAPKSPTRDTFAQGPSPQYSPGPSKATLSPALMRRMSLPDLNVPPPAYPIDKMATPRDEEGMERLPVYSCSVHIEGGMMRKMEFSAPGVQAKDRSWKKQYFVLNGTRLCVYKNDVRKFPVKGQPQNRHVVDETTVETDSPHVHLPPSALPLSSSSRIRATSSQLSRHSSRTSTNSVRSTGGSSISQSRSAPIATTSKPPSTTGTAARGDEKVKPTTTRDSAAQSSSGTSQLTTTTSRQSSRSNLTASSSSHSNISHSHSHSASNAQTTSHSHSHSHSHSLSLSTVSSTFHVTSNALVKQYTLQGAESGLGTDYLKRKNVIRVRCEGEQFLLQANDSMMVVHWIEAFQAATNIALDLDTRPMPKPPMFPRRRRRRQQQQQGQGSSTTSGNTALNANASSSSTSNARSPSPNPARQNNTAAVRA